MIPLFPSSRMRCADCLYWKSITERQHGNCRRHAPRESDWEFPETHRTDGCGDFVRNYLEDSVLIRELIDKDFAKDNPWIFNAMRISIPRPYLFKQGWSWAWHVYTFVIDGLDFGLFFAAQNFAPRLYSKVDFPWFPRLRPTKRFKHPYQDVERDRATLLVEIMNHGLVHELFPTYDLPESWKKPLFDNPDEEPNEDKEEKTDQEDQ